MMTPTDLLKIGGEAAFLGGIFVATTIVVGDEQGFPARAWARYVAYLERKLRRMFLWTSGHKIAVMQIAGVFACFAAYVLVHLPFWYLYALACLAIPPYQVERMRQKRIAAIEAQIDGFVLALANALKTTPSLGDAFRSIQTIVRDPIKQELELALKEMRFGATLDQALMLMASRVGSRQLDTALSAVLIGRQVGGNLPKVLETTAASLREMARLEGVVRTKTAEGKTQMWVLALFPFFMMLAFNVVSPGYFQPLMDGFVGYLIVGVATCFWISSLFLARKILNVEV
jgi:tight adherence protein B